MQNTPQTRKVSSLRSDSQSLVLEPIPRSPGNNLARPEVKLARTVSHGRAVVVDISDELPAVDALDLGPLPLDPPVVDGLEEGDDLILFFEAEFGGIDGGE